MGCNKYNKKELDENEIIISYQSGNSIFNIRKIFKTSKKRVEDILINKNIFIKDRDVLKKEFTNNEIEEIKDLYIIKNLSCEKIGKIFNSSKTPIQKLLRELKLLKKGFSNGVKIDLTEKQKEKIKYMYLKEYKVYSEISKEMNLTHGFIQNYIINSDYIRSKSEANSISNVKKYSGQNYDEYLKSLPEFVKYRKIVIKITNKENIKSLLNYDKRGNSGIKGSYHLDHKYSISEGFKNNIKPEIIGNIKNLEFIPWEDNLKKKNKCSITITQLINT